MFRHRTGLPGWRPLARGLPTTAGQTIANLPGADIAGLGEPYQFFFADLSAAVAGDDTLYVADDGVGLRKFSLVGGNWTSNGTFGRSRSGGLRGLTGTVAAGSLRLYASGSSPAAAATRFGSSATAAATTARSDGSMTIFYAGVTNVAYRGLALAHQPAIVPNPVISAGGGANNIVVSKSGANLVVTVNGTQVFSQAVASTLSLTVNGQDGADTLVVELQRRRVFQSADLVRRRQPD